MLTDVVMPGMSGPELARQLAPARPEMRVLFASGYTAHILSDPGVLSSGRAFIAKPFTPDDLLAKVREVLDA
jgi:two-component system, cell cycle sensor histidine kinase and response regulator CckA